MKSRPFGRLLTALVALAQLSGASVAVVADAQAQAISVNDRSHIEAERNAQCHAQHRDDCAVCRHLSTATVAPERPPLPSTRAPRIGVVADARVVAPHHGIGREPPARAPPPLS